MKWLIRIFGILVFIPFLSLFLWYLICFLPHTDKLNKRIMSGEKIVSGVTDIQKITVASEGEDGIRLYAIRQAYRAISVEKDYEKGMLSWHINTSLWYYFSKIYYSNDDMFFMWVTLAPSKKTIGLNNTSKYYFKKELRKLSLREKTEIIVIARSPSKYKLGSTGLNKRVNTIISNLTQNEKLINVPLPLPQ